MVIINKTEYDKRQKLMRWLFPVILVAGIISVVFFIISVIVVLVLQFTYFKGVCIFKSWEKKYSVPPKETFTCQC